MRISKALIGLVFALVISACQVFPLETPTPARSAAVSSTVTIEPTPPPVEAQAAVIRSTPTAKPKCQPLEEDQIVLWRYDYQVPIRLSQVQAINLESGIPASVQFETEPTHGTIVEAKFLQPAENACVLVKAGKLPQEFDFSKWPAYPRLDPFHELRFQMNFGQGEKVYWVSDAKNISLLTPRVLTSTAQATEIEWNFDPAFGPLDRTETNDGPKAFVGWWDDVRDLPVVENFPYVQQCNRPYPQSLFVQTLNSGWVMKLQIEEGFDVNLHELVGPFGLKVLTGPAGEPEMAHLVTDNGGKTWTDWSQTGGVLEWTGKGWKITLTSD